MLLLSGARTTRMALDPRPEDKAMIKQDETERTPVKYHRPQMRIVNKGGIGRRTKVFIDDVDVSGCFSDVTIRSRCDDLVIADLTAVAVECEVQDALVLRFVDDATRDLLIKHGWTPPAESD